MSDLIITHHLPPAFVALSSETLAKVADLTAKAAACQPTDADGLTAGNALFRSVDDLRKAISTSRLDLTRPIDALKAEIMEAERKATLPLEQAKADLGRRLAALATRLERERQEAERKARAEAEAAARAERARLEAERQEQIRKQAEARAAQEAAAMDAADLFGEPVALPPEPPPPPPVVIPERMISPPSLPPAPKAAARIATRTTWEVVDLVAFLAQACANGGKIHGKLVLMPDPDALESLRKAGVDRPAGVQEVTTESVAKVGRRGAA